jgi:FtsH-binding integral membrane protein
MDIKFLHYVLTIGILVLGIAKNTLSYNPIRFHCDNYILNTYLYFLLSWAIMMATNKYLEDKEIKLSQLFSGPFTILLCFASMGLIMGLVFMPPQMFFTKHFLYIIEIVLFGILLYPLYIKNKQLFFHIALSTFGLLLVLSIISFAKPDIIKDSWEMYLFMGLVSLLGARLIELFMNFSHKSKYSRALSYGSILLFSMYIMVDTKKIIINAENCVNPDYINESINLVLDTMNIFTNMYSLNND